MRLFIINSHSSHLNIKFMDFCETYYIIFNFLPPYSTHRLQPLNIDIFFSLIITYSSEIDTLYSLILNLVELQNAIFSYCLDLLGNLF